MAPIKDYLLQILYRLNISKNKWPKTLLKYANMQSYKKHFGYEFDYNHPKNFTEKIQWYKFNYQHIDMLKIVDKYEFKNYIKLKLGEGYTISVFGVWDSVEAFRKDWSILPDKFCLKSTLSSEGNNIKVIIKQETDLNELCSQIESWFDKRNTLVNSYCCGYHKGIPRILAEEYKESVKNQLYDYKIFCFDGKPFCIYAAAEHFMDEHYPISFYDFEWNMMDVKYGEHRNEFVPKPKHLEKMKELALQLSQGFPYIRVDFFDTDDKLYLAEMTFYPGGGFSQYSPSTFNDYLGDLFVLPPEN